MHSQYFAITYSIAIFNALFIDSNAREKSSKTLNDIKNKHEMGHKPDYRIQCISCFVCNPPMRAHEFPKMFIFK